MLSAEPQTSVASTQVLFPPSQVTTHGPPPHSNRAVRHAELPSQEIVQSPSLGQRMIVSRHALLPSHMTTQGLPAGQMIVWPWQVPLPSQLNRQASPHSAPGSGSLQTFGPPVLDPELSDVIDPSLEAVVGSSVESLVAATVELPDVSVDPPDVFAGTADPGSPSHSGFAFRQPTTAQHTIRRGRACPLHHVIARCRRARLVRETGDGNLGVAAMSEGMWVAVSWPRWSVCSAGVLLQRDRRLWRSSIRRRRTHRGDRPPGRQRRGSPRAGAGGRDAVSNARRGRCHRAPRERWPRAVAPRTAGHEAATAGSPVAGRGRARRSSEGLHVGWGLRALLDGPPSVLGSAGPRLLRGSPRPHRSDHGQDRRDLRRRKSHRGLAGRLTGTDERPRPLRHRQRLRRSPGRAECGSRDDLHGRWSRCPGDHGWSPVPAAARSREWKGAWVVALALPWCLLRRQRLRPRSVGEGCHATRRWHRDGHGRRRLHAGAPTRPGQAHPPARAGRADTRHRIGAARVQSGWRLYSPRRAPRVAVQEDEQSRRRHRDVSDRSTRCAGLLGRRQPCRDCAGTVDGGPSPPRSLAPAARHRPCLLSRLPRREGLRRSAGTSTRCSATGPSRL